MSKCKRSGKKPLKKYNGGYNPRPLSNTPNGAAPWYGMGTSSLQNNLAPMPTANPITNTASSNGSMPSIGKGGNIAGAVVDFAGAAINSFSDPTLSGTNQTYVAKGPIQYQKTDYINNTDEYSKLKKENTGNTLKSMGTGAAAGAAIGSIVPGIGTVIGGAIGAIGGAVTGLFGSGKRKRELRKKIKKENQNITNRNQFNLSDVHSGMLEQEYYSDNEDTQDDALYNEGKTPTTSMHKANALVGKGETIVDGNTGNMTEVTSGSAVGTDDVPAIIKPEDAIAGNKRNPRTGNTFAEDMKPLTRMESKLKRNTERNIRSIADNTEKLVKSYTQPLANIIISEQANVINDKNKAKYADGKNFGDYATNALTTVGTLAPSIWNTIQGAQAPETVSTNQLYAPNQYAQSAITKMSKRRYNVNPELEALKSLERRQRYGARALGSEGGINRAMDLAGALGLARQASNIYANKQNIDNDYIAQQANMMASLGTQEASNQSNAMRTAYDINARNRATQKAYQQAGLQGFSNYAQQQQLNSNRQKMDDARLRVLQNYYKLGTTDNNMSYILGPLMNQ